MNVFWDRDLLTIPRRRNMARKGRNRCTHGARSVFGPIPNRNVSKSPSAAIGANGGGFNDDARNRTELTVEVISAEQTSQTYLTPPSVVRVTVFFLMTPIVPGYSSKWMRRTEYNSCDTTHRKLFIYAMTSQRLSSYSVNVSASFNMFLSFKDRYWYAVR